MYHFSSVSQQPEAKAERRMFMRRGGRRSSSSSSAASLTEIAEEAAITEIAVPEKILDNYGVGKLYVAVGEDVENGKSNLVWAARNFLLAGNPKLVLLHVHGPLNQYLDFCRVSLKIQAETLVIEKNSHADGIIELIDQNHITSLVMGTSSFSP